MRFNLEKFFDRVRQAPFGGSLRASQVAGMCAILEEARLFPSLTVNHLAYALATTFHETAQTMQPIAEYGKGAGRPYGKPAGPTGERYYGRGYVQLTWFANYVKASKVVGVDLIREPDLAMRPDIAAHIMFSGMLEGWFTGRRLSDYDRPDGFAPVAARRIINGRNKVRHAKGLDKDADYDTVIAGYYHAFRAALSAAEMPPEKATTPPSSAPAPAPTKPSAPAPQTFWSALINRLRKVFA